MKMAVSTTTVSMVIVLAMLVGAGCSSVDVEPEEPDLREMFFVDSTLFEIELIDGSGTGEYGVRQPIPVLFTNRTDSALYLPLCGGTPPPPRYQRRVDGEWRDAILLTVPAVGCTESLAVEPGASFSDTHWLIFPLASGSLPLDGETPDIEDVYGRYRLRFEVFGAPWSAGPPSSEVLETKVDMFSNSFNITAAKSQK